MLPLFFFLYKALMTDKSQAGSSFTPTYTDQELVEARIILAEILNEVFTSKEGIIIEALLLNYNINNRLILISFLDINLWLCILVYWHIGCLQVNIQAIPKHNIVFNV